MQCPDLKIIDNYVNNVNEILFEVKKPEIDKLFASRAVDAVGTGFRTLDGKNSTMYTLFGFEMPNYLKKICIETVDFKIFPEPYVCINKYPPGSWLGKHKDGPGAYWKFQLIFLQSTKSHFTWYDIEDNPYLVEEIPGRCVNLPLHVVHESTILEQHEDTKYSMVFTWGGKVDSSHQSWLKY